LVFENADKNDKPLERQEKKKAGTNNSSMG
jgi:hypothetical protein